MEEPLSQIVIVAGAGGTYDVITFRKGSVEERCTYEAWPDILGDVVKAVMLLEPVA